MDSAVDSDWLELQLIQSQSDDKICRLLAVEYDKGSDEGNNYASVMYRVKLKVLLSSGKTAVRSVMIKKETKALKDAQSEVFRTEIQMYRTVIPLMEDVMDEFNDERDKLWGKCFGCRPYSCLIIEDLVVSGFETRSRLQMLDLNHGLAVLRELGRFHALSKTLLARKVIKADAFPPYFMVGRDSNNEGFYSGLFTTAATAVSGWGDDWKDIGRKIGAQAKEFRSKMKGLLEIPKGGFEVLCHGDCWTCNILFKYSEHQSSAPVGVRFIDFQLTHVNSYMWDCVHFLYVCLVPSVRRDCIRTLLKTYQESLAMNLRLFGWTGHVPTVEEVEKEHERLNFVAFVFNIGFHAIATADVHNPMNIEKAVEGKFDEVFNIDMFNDEFKRRVGPDLMKYVENGTV